MTYNSDMSNGKKTYQITVRVSDKVRKKIEKFAEKQEMDIAKYVRKAIETQVMIDEEYPELTDIIEERENANFEIPEDADEIEARVSMIMDAKIKAFEDRIIKRIEDFEKKHPAKID